MTAPPGSFAPLRSGMTTRPGSAAGRGTRRGRSRAANFPPMRRGRVEPEKMTETFAEIVIGVDT